MVEALLGLLRYRWNSQKITHHLHNLLFDYIQNLQSKKVIKNSITEIITISILLYFPDYY